MATRNAIIKRNNSGTIDTIHPETTWDQVKGKPLTFTATGHTHPLAEISDVSAGTLAEATVGTVTGNRTWSPQILKQSIEALSDLNTNNYLSGVTGSGNGTVTFARQGLGSLTWNASHGHAASEITESTTRRFVSDGEKATWNGALNEFVGAHYGVSQGQKGLVPAPQEAQAYAFLRGDGNWTQITTSLIGAEPAFSKNTAFNKSFGTTAGTVSEGSHTHSNYLTSIPTASASVLGGIKVGSRLSISNGVLSANSQTDNNFTTTLKNKLEGIATGATNVVESTVSYWGFTKNTGTVTGTGSANTLAFWTDTGSIDALGPSTYPNLTELSHVKGVTSSIQTQLNGKAASGHVHSTYNRASSVLSGASVFSNIVVTDGIVTSIATRNLTAANVGAVSTSGTAYNSTRFGGYRLRVGDYSEGLTGYITLGY